MMHPDQIKEAEAYCDKKLDEVDARMWLDSVEHPHEFREQFIAIRDRITELEGKIARARKALEDANDRMGGLARISFQIYIDAALKELK